MSVTLHASPGQRRALHVGQSALRLREAALHDIKKMPLLLRLFSLVSK